MTDHERNLARLLSTAGVQDLDQLPPIPRTAVEYAATLHPSIVDGLCLALSRQRHVLLRAVTESRRGRGGQMQATVSAARDGGVTMDEINAAQARGIMYAALDRRETWDTAERLAGMRSDEIDRALEKRRWRCLDNEASDKKKVRIQ